MLNIYSIGKSKGKKIRHGIIYVVLSIGAAVMLLPFAWTVSTSLKLPDQIYTERIQWLPGRTVLDLCRDGGSSEIQVADQFVTVKSVPEGVGFRFLENDYVLRRGESIVLQIEGEKILVECDPGPIYRVISSGKQRPVDMTTAFVNDIHVRVSYQDKPVDLRFRKKSVLFSVPGAKALEASVVNLERPKKRFVFQPEWVNFAEALTIRPFIFPTKERPYSYLFNTVRITFLTLVFTLFFSSCCAYGFARFQAPGKDLLFTLLLSTMMLPAIVTLIPVFIMFRWLGWIDTIKPLVLPAVFGAPFFIFLLRQFFLSIPKDLEDAARIDGAGSFEIFYRIMLPLAKPALATVAIFTFMGSWNNFMGPLIFLNSESKWTLQVALSSFMGAYGGDMHLMMAVTVVILAPPLILFMFCQRYFIEGIVTTGLKA